MRVSIHRILYYSFLFFFPLQLGKHFWPSWSLVLGRRIDYLSPTITALDIFSVAMLVAFLVSSFRSKKVSLRDVLRFLQKNWIGFAGVGLYMLVNSCFADRPWVSAFSFLQIVTATLPYFYIILAKPSLSRSIVVFSSGLAWTFLIALLQVSLSHSLGGVFWFLGERSFNYLTPAVARAQLCIFSSCTEILRGYGTFPHPNVLGGVFVMVNIFLVFLLTKRIKNSGVSESRRLAEVLLLLVSHGGILLSFSRVAIGLGVVFDILVVLTALRIRQRFKNIVILGGLVILFCVFLVLPFSQTPQSVSERQFLLNRSIQMMQIRPIFGVGFRNFIPFLSTMPTDARSVVLLQPVHNILLLVLSELGIVGFIGCLWLLRTYWQMLGVRTLEKLVPLLSLAVLASFDHYLITLPHGMYLLFVTIGFTYLFSWNRS